MNGNSDLFEKFKQTMLWLWTLATFLPGVILVLLGIGAIALPHFAPLTINMVLAWVFIIGGIVKILYGIRPQNEGGFWGKLLDGLIDLVLGILLATDILTGILTLTLIVGVSLFISGVLTVIRAFKIPSAPNWGWFLFSGIIKIILGVIIWSQWPSNPEWLIGLFVGLAFLATGFSLIKLSLTITKTSSEEA